MAQNAEHFDNAPHGVHLIIDGHEMNDVIAYRVERDFSTRRCTLTVVTEVMEKIRMNLKERCNHVQRLVEGALFHFQEYFAHTIMVEYHLKPGPFFGQLRQKRGCFFMLHSEISEYAEI